MVAVGVLVLAMPREGGRGAEGDTRMVAVGVLVLAMPREGGRGAEGDTRMVAVGVLVLAMQRVTCWRCPAPPRASGKPMPIDS